MYDDPRMQMRKHEEEQIRRVLRLIWPDLKEDCLIWYVHDNPWMAPDGPIKLDPYSVRIPKHGTHGTEIYEYQFTAARKMVDEKEYVFLLLFNTDLGDAYMKLFSINQEGNP